VTAGEATAVVVGGYVVAVVLLSALRTVVLPQGELTRITRFVFAVANRVFTSANPRRLVPRRLSGVYAPAALVSLPFAWSMLIAVGFTFVFWGLDVGSLHEAWVTSGSSLFTLGFARPEGSGLILLTFIEATIGLGIVALLISFLPTLYVAYSTREQGVGLLAPLIGRPPSAVQLLSRLHAAHAIAGKGIWSDAAGWFVALEQSHTAFPALAGFPPQREDRSWVVTAGAVLDAASLVLSASELDDDEPLMPGLVGDERAELGGLVLVLVHGASAVTGIARASAIDVPEPSTLVEMVAGVDELADDNSVTREEYEAAIDQLCAAGALADVDKERGWDRFRRIRSSYDRSIRGLAGLTHAPPAPWTTDRALVVGRPRFFSTRPIDTSEA
jgi:uncharacterized membrane protein